MHSNAQITNKRPLFRISAGNIAVNIIPSYISQEEIDENDEKKNYFCYHVTIYNANPFKIKLISRYWLIINADGETEEVEGPGVIGQTPTIGSHKSYTYQSYCSLDTDWGTMEGFYIMMLENGNVIKVKIDRFYLIKK